jgi:type VI secretion system VgrG family protein
MSYPAQRLNSFVHPASAFSADTRLYQLNTRLGDDALLVESFVGKEELSTLYEFHVNCLSSDVHLELKRLLGQQVTLRTRLADGTQGARSGYVSQVTQLGADGGFARYRLTLVPWLWMSTQRRRSRVFQDKSVLAIIEEVLAADAPRNHWRATADAEAFLGNARIRSYCCQYRESDYAFVTRLLAEEGIGFYFEETDDDHTGVSRQRLVLFADSTLFPDDYSAAHVHGGHGIRFHRESAVEVQDTIQALGSERRLQSAITTIAGWDYKAKRVVATSLPTSHRFGSDNAPQIECYDWSGVYPFATQHEANHYARIVRDVTDARFKSWFGHSSVRTFHPGTAFDLTESQFDQRAALGLGDASGKRRFALTGVLHAGVNNLPTSLKKEIASRLGSLDAYQADDGRSGADAHLDDDITAQYLHTSAWDSLLTEAEATGYANRFTAIRADIPWRPALADGTGLLLNPKPTALGSQTAIVVDADGSTAQAGTVHTDDLGRIRIRYPWQQGEQNTCWVRVAQMYAGPGYGSQFIPRIGQEVVVKFLDNDIDRPLVTGTLYNGQGQDDAQAYAAAGDHTPAAQDNKIGNGASPAWHGAAAEHRHAAFLSGFKSVALGADGYSRESNQLVFDDTTGRLRTRFATDTAASQLNLGHLIHQADNYRGSFRGTGWELRTDAYGAIRAGKGLLISTYHGRAPGGNAEPAGDNSAGVALLKQAQGFADTFNRAAALHQTVQFILVKGGAHNGGNSQSRLDVERAPIDAMLKAISGIVDAHDGSIDGRGQKIPHMHAPMVVVTAQAGFGVAASDGLHIAAGEVAHFASGRDLHIAVGDALTMHAGQAVGLLAGAVGAGEGNTGIKLYAGQGDIDLQAQSDTMTFAAKELVKLISANSHIDFAAAKSITLCTEAGASITIEGGNITFACPGTLSIKASSKSFTGPASLGYPLPTLPRSALPAKDIKFDLRLTDVPGKDAHPLAHTPWKIAGGGSPPQGMAFVDDKLLVAQGITDADGKVQLSDAEQKALSAAYCADPMRTWLMYPGHTVRLSVHEEDPQWNEDEMLLHALSAADFSEDVHTSRYDDGVPDKVRYAKHALGVQSPQAIAPKLKR